MRVTEHSLSCPPVVHGRLIRVLHLSTFSTAASTVALYVGAADPSAGQHTMQEVAAAGVHAYAGAVWLSCSLPAAEPGAHAQSRRKGRTTTCQTCAGLMQLF